MIRALLFFLALSGILSPEIASAQKQAGTPAVSAQNIVELRKSIGKTVTVNGFVERASKSRSGNQFLNFRSSELSVICFASDVRRFTNGEPIKQFAKKQVQISGKLELYRNKLQIKLSNPSQIKIVGKTSKTTTKAPASEFKLKKVGENSWISPAGLKYKGLDPAGLNRVEHVLRHAKDIPSRAGPHGVFDGDDNQALATIDEAWTKIKQKRIKAKNEGRRSSYTVSMGRKIGYLGGQTGRRKRNPPLSRVFIVVNTGTSEVITAFPK